MRRIIVVLLCVCGLGGLVVLPVAEATGKKACVPVKAGFPCGPIQAGVNFGGRSGGPIHLFGVKMGPKVLVTRTRSGNNTSSRSVCWTSVPGVIMVVVVVIRANGSGGFTYDRVATGSHHGCKLLMTTFPNPPPTMVFQARRG